MLFAVRTDIEIFKQEHRMKYQCSSVRGHHQKDSFHSYAPYLANAPCHDELVFQFWY